MWCKECSIISHSLVSFLLKRGLNNWVELKYLATLLRIALEKELKSIQVFRDSKMSIVWEDKQS